MKKWVIIGSIFVILVIIGMMSPSAPEQNPQQSTKPTQTTTDQKKEQQPSTDCPILDGVPIEEWNPLMTGIRWGSDGNPNVKLDAYMDSEGKMASFGTEQSRWAEYLASVDLKGYSLVERPNSNCWAYQNKVGYNPNYNYCFVKLKKNLLDTEGNVEEVKRETMVAVFERSVIFPINTTALFGDDFSLWTFTNLSFVKSYCEPTRVGGDIIIQG